MAIQKKKGILYHPDIRILVEAIGVILIWRGVWVMADRYLFPDHPHVSAGVSIAVGLLILYWGNRNLKELK